MAQALAWGSAGRNARQTFGHRMLESQKTEKRSQIVLRVLKGSGAGLQIENWELQIENLGKSKDTEGAAGRAGAVYSQNGERNFQFSIFNFQFAILVPRVLLSRKKRESRPLPAVIW